MSVSRKLVVLLTAVLFVSSHAVGASMTSSLRDMAFKPSAPSVPFSFSYGLYPRRSNMCPSNTGCFDFRAEVDGALLMKLYNEWVDVAPNYFGDYYPLTPYSLDETAWMAVQFNDAGKGRGHIQAYRRKDCAQAATALPLFGLVADSTYTVKNYDLPEMQSFTGKQLMEDGVPVEISAQPGAAVIAHEIGKE